MRKEVIIAIIAGICLGLIVAFAIRTARISLSSVNQAKINSTTQTETDSDPTSHTILINSPSPDTITNLAEITVIGSTTPESLLAVISNSSSDTVFADENGAFATTLELEAGVNTISITSYSPSGEDAAVTFSLVYSTAELSATISAQADEE